MAFAYEVFPFAGTDYNVNFPYLDITHLHVFVDGVETTDWTWINPTKIRLGDTVTGDFVELRRKSSPDKRLVDYQVPGPLTEDDLDMDSLQALYLSQEALDIEQRVMNVQFNDQWDARNKRIEHLANSVNPTDAVNRSELDAAVLSAGNVPKPFLGDVGKFLKATAVDLWSWAQLTYADIAGTINDIVGTLSLSKGGTGATDAAGARDNLGLGTSAVLDVGTLAGQVLKLTEDNKLPAIDGSALLGISDTGRLLNIVDFTASGTYTKNPNASFIIVHVLGGGGSASGGTGAGSIYGTGISGASAGYALKRISSDQLGTTETVTIGNGGAQSTPGGGGNNGGTSSFGSHCSATGGGQLNGGQGVGGDINLRGQCGFLNTMYSGANACAAPGAPAPGPIGGPGGGALTVVGTGNAAPANSGGGGGAGLTPYNSAGSTCAGGAGGSGRVVVFEYA